MTWIYVAQLLVPIGLVFWLLAFGPASRTGFWVQTTASLLALAALTRIGIWLFPPWWTPHAAALLLLGVAFWQWRGLQHRPVLPTRVHGWLALLFFGLVGIAGVSFGARAWFGACPPAAEAVALSWPLQGGQFLVVNGGNDLLINSHLESLLSDDPRFLPWRGNRWAVDLVAIDGLGLRSTGFMPDDPARYLAFGWPVAAPCTGSVVTAVDGLPDMPVPEYDRDHLAGNHVILACEGLHVILAHLRRGSLRVGTGEVVETGALLGEVGNSGGTNEPHLHIHAQRPGPPGAPMGGEPLPMRLDGRFLVRGDRVLMLETD